MIHVNKHMISFFVTTSRNLDCRYCYTNKSETDRRNQKIDLEYAQYPLMIIYGCKYL